MTTSGWIGNTRVDAFGTADEGSAVRRLEKLFPDAPEQLNTFAYASLADAVTIDAQGRKPGEEGWQATYDVFFLAGLVALKFAAFNAAMPQVTRISSEGESLTFTPVNWEEAAERFFALSPLTQRHRRGGNSFQLIPMDRGDNWRPRSARRGGDWDVDTETGSRSD